MAVEGHAMLSEFRELAAACVLFVGAHFLLSSLPVRRRLAGWLGQGGYLLLYSAIALALFAWMIWSFRLAPYHWIWGSPDWARMIAFAVMPIALMLLIAGYLTPNPSAVMGGYVLERDDPAPGIFKVTRHPVMIAVALWAAAHLLANGTAGGILLFGSLLILSLGGIAHIERRRRASGDANWQRLVAVTSIMPFAAILAGRTRFAFTPMDWTRLALGLGLYPALLFLHGPVFGVWLVGRP
jgi:uncharacterized membrane protein